jgi:hypothetical protein
MTILAFMVGRCGRKLPVDGMSPASSTARGSVPRTGHDPHQNPQDAAGPMPTKHLARTGPALQRLRRQNSKLCVPIDPTIIWCRQHAERRFRR